MASKLRMISKRFYFNHNGQSWARSLGNFSRSKDSTAKDKAGTKNSRSGQWGPQQEKNAADHGKDYDPKIFLDEPIPDHFMGYHLEDPVRNTEREYFQTHANPNWIGHQRGRFDSRFHSKKYGISKEVYAWLHWDMNFNDNDQIKLWQQQTKFRLLKEDQRYIHDRVQALGYELAAAHFIVARGGAIKFEGRDLWFKMDANKAYNLPRHQVDNLYVEAVDASKMDLTHVAFDIIGSLERVRFMKFKSCPYIDDWCLARLVRLQECLEFLEIDDCEGVTDNGLSSLQSLRKLKCLRLSNMPNVKHLGLITLYLEELLPELTILGITAEDLKPPAWKHRGECRRVRALLGDLTDPDTFAQANEVPLEKCEDDSYLNTRLVREAD